MNVALIVIISLALVFVLASSAGNYEYLMFVQQWPKSVCYDGGCTKQAPRPSVFTIHGLWPANYSGATLTCTGAQFDQKVMDDKAQATLKANLEKYSWPDVIKGNHMAFWRHEWTAHGRCCDSVFPQTPYFQWCHNTWGQKVIGQILARSSINPGASYSLSAIENAIKANTARTPYIRCVTSKKDKSVLLTEVVICYDYYGRNIINCTKRSNCRATGISYPK